MDKKLSAMKNLISVFIDEIKNTVKIWRDNEFYAYANYRDDLDGNYGIYAYGIDSWDNEVLLPKTTEAFETFIDACEYDAEIPDIFDLHFNAKTKVVKFRFYRFVVIFDKEERDLVKEVFETYVKALGDGFYYIEGDAEEKIGEETEITVERANDDSEDPAPVNYFIGIRSEFKF